MSWSVTWNLTSPACSVARPRRARAWRPTGEWRSHEATTGPWSAPNSFCSPDVHAAHSADSHTVASIPGNNTTSGYVHNGFKTKQNIEEQKITNKPRFGFGQAAFLITSYIGHNYTSVLQVDSVTLKVGRVSRPSDLWRLPRVPQRAGGAAPQKRGWWLRLRLLASAAWQRQRMRRTALDQCLAAGKQTQTD